MATELSALMDDSVNRGVVEEGCSFLGVGMRPPKIPGTSVRPVTGDGFILRLLIPDAVWE